MDTATQQNAALVEEAAAAAQSLREQTIALTDVVSLFKIDEPAANAVLAAPSRPALAAGARMALGNQGREAA
jgi:hypothetical protein